MASVSMPIFANGTSSAVYSVFRTFDQQRMLLESIFRLLPHSGTPADDGVIVHMDYTAK